MSRQKGFTLVEIIIALTIITIASAAAIPSFTSHVQKAPERECAANMETLKTSMDEYFNAQIISTGTLDSDTSVDGLKEIMDKYSSPACPENGTYSYDAGKKELSCDVHTDNTVPYELPLNVEIKAEGATEVTKAPATPKPTPKPAISTPAPTPTTAPSYPRLVLYGRDNKEINGKEFQYQPYSHPREYYFLFARVQLSEDSFATIAYWNRYTEDLDIYYVNFEGSPSNPGGSHENAIYNGSDGKYTYNVSYEYEGQLLTADYTLVKGDVTSTPTPTPAPEYELILYGYDGYGDDGKPMPLYTDDPNHEDNRVINDDTLIYKNGTVPINDYICFARIKNTKDDTFVELTWPQDKNYPYDLHPNQLHVYGPDGYALYHATNIEGEYKLKVTCDYTNPPLEAYFTLKHIKPTPTPTATPVPTATPAPTPTTTPAPTATPAAGGILICYKGRHDKLPNNELAYVKQGIANKKPDGFLVEAPSDLESLFANLSIRPKLHDDLSLIYGVDFTVSGTYTPTKPGTYSLKIHPLVGNMEDVVLNVKVYDYGDPLVVEDILCGNGKKGKLIFRYPLPWEFYKIRHNDTPDTCKIFNSDLVTYGDGFYMAYLDGGVDVANINITTNNTAGFGLIPRTPEKTVVLRTDDFVNLTTNSSDTWKCDIPAHTLGYWDGMVYITPQDITKGTGFYGTEWKALNTMYDGEYQWEVQFPEDSYKMRLFDKSGNMLNDKKVTLQNRDSSKPKWGDDAKNVLNGLTITDENSVCMLNSSTGGYTVELAATDYYNAETIYRIRVTAEHGGKIYREYFSVAIEKMITNSKLEIYDKYNNRLSEDKPLIYDIGSTEQLPKLSGLYRINNYCFKNVKLAGDNWVEIKLSDTQYTMEVTPKYNPEKTGKYKVTVNAEAFGNKYSENFTISLIKNHLEVYGYNNGVEELLNGKTLEYKVGTGPYQYNNSFMTRMQIVSEDEKVLATGSPGFTYHEFKFYDRNVPGIYPITIKQNYNNKEYIATFNIKVVE